MERTLSIIKPDAVRKGLIGEIIRTFELNNINITAMKMIHMDKKTAEGFYHVHKDKPFFPSVVEFMTSGPSVVMALEGKDIIARNRALMGATDPKKAEPGTIRATFGTDIQHNVVHGSDSPETARFEIGYFLPS